MVEVGYGRGRVGSELSQLVGLGVVWCGVVWWGGVGCGRVGCGGMG